MRWLERLRRKRTMAECDFLFGDWQDGPPQVPLTFHVERRVVLDHEGHAITVLTPVLDGNLVNPTVPTPILEPSEEGPEW